jgi:Tfp pilus assembly protein PilF
MKTISTGTRKGKKQKSVNKQSRQSRWRTPDNTHYLAIGALVAAVVAVYANSLAGDFVFDDQYLVLIYSRPRSLAHLFDMLIDSYRPIRNLSYILDYIVWGAHPFGFHLTNVLMHAANTVLVFLLARRFSLSQAAAFLTALIFAVHPIQTDAVAYISGRRDVLFTLFYLAAFHSYLTYHARRKIGYFALFLVCWACGLMAKEMAISLPLLIFLWNFCDRWGAESGSWMAQTARAARQAFSKDKWLYLVLGVMAAAFIWYMLFVRHASGRADSAGLHYWGGSVWATLLTVIRVQAWYLKQLVWPTPIAQYFGAFDISTSLVDWRVWLSLAVVGSALAAGFVLLKRHRVMAFAVLSYFALLLPVSQIIPHHELLADHYLYLPMMSFGLLAALFVERLVARGQGVRQLAYATITIAVVVMGVMTIIRNGDWRDELSVWQANYASAPHSPRASSNLGTLYATRRESDKAEALLKQSLVDDPSFEPSYLALARLYVLQKRTPEAEALIHQGMALIDTETRSFIMRNPSLMKSQFTTVLAAAKWEAGDKSAMEPLLEQAIAIYPPNLSPYEALANLYHDQNRGKEADTLRLAITAVPSAYDFRARLASLLVEAKQYDEALRHLQQMLALDPNDGECRKARPYLGATRAATPNTMELRAIDETLRRLDQQCSRR